MWINDRILLSLLPVYPNLLRGACWKIKARTLVWVGCKGVDYERGLFNHTVYTMEVPVTPLPPLRHCLLRALLGQASTRALGALVQSTTHHCSARSTTCAGYTIRMVRKPGSRPA